MAATSLTLELVADADLATINTAVSERPKRISLASDDEQQKHSSSRESLSASPMQQHLAASPTTPTSATLSPSGSATAMSPSSSSSSFLPEMPQWKKDLIQRRKTNAAKSGAIGGAAQSPLLSPQQRFSAGHETDGLSLTSVQYTAKISRSATPATKTQTTSQQQQFSSTSATKTQHFNITAEEQQLQQQRIAKTNANAIKTPATHTQTTKNPQQCEEDVDPLISPTTKEETAEKFIIGGHSTPQVNSSSSMDPSDLAGPVAEVAAETAATTTTTNKITAPIPKQRSLLVAPTKLLSTKEPDSCTNSSATAAAPSTTRLTSSSSPTIKNRVEKVETDEELHETEAVKVEAEESSPITTKTKSRRKQHTVKSKCGTYSSSTSTTTSAPPPLTPTGNVGKLTAGTTLLCSPLYQSQSSNESDKSFTVTTPFGNSALLPNTTTTANQKLLDIEKLEKSNQSPKISTKLQSNQFIKNQTATAASGTTAKKFIKHKTVTEEQSSTAACNTAGSPTKKKTTATTAVNKKKMVAVQEMKKTSTNHHIIGTAASGNTTTTCGRQSQQSQQHSANHSTNNGSDFDACEDLSYGPGIVSKLRCRYLSLALRESMEKQRHALDTLRRATSLNNLLDRDEQHKHAGEEDDDEDVDDHIVEDDFGEDQENLPPRPAIGSGILRSTQDQQQQHNVTKKTATFQKYASASNAHARMSQSQKDFSPVDNSFRSRHIKRGNDSLKRARSVEALLCEKSPWNFAYNRSSLESSKQLPPSSNRGSSSNVTIEDKIHNARERLVLGTDSMPPRRLTSIIDDTERPPPDLVKQTLKKFEATANRRGRGVNRSQGNGEVANKVASYRSIIKEQKPAIVFPKPPLSPTKKAAIKHASRPIALAAADLIGSPIGRKAAAAAATTAPVVGSPLGGFSPIVAETSTPKQKLPMLPAAALDLTPTLSLVAESGSCLSDNSPDIIPRHSIKLLSETAAADFAVDSPVTILTKKLEKLRIDADKANKQIKQHVIAKEFQTKPNQLQQADTASSIEFVGGDAEDKTDKHHNSNGTRSNENKNNSDDANDNDKNTNDDEVDDFDDRCAEAESVKAGTGSASSDLSDDEYGTTKTTKRVSKTALENIAKAGTSQQFIFASNQQQKSITESLPTTATGKQIGIIRPLHQLPTTSSCSTSSASSVASNESFASRQTASNNQQHMETLKSHQQQTHTVSHSNTNARTHTNQHHHHPPALTSREIEKNRINEMKKTATAVTNAAATDASAAPASATTTSLDTVIVTGGSSGSSSKASGLSELDAAATITHNSSPLWALQTKKKRQPPAAVAENNSMVFNFSNRKEVPDYIENDGVVIRRKRELPKPNESGFVLLGDLSLETSTDSDYDDFSVCPPSPCDVEFENAHIVIDGKSSIRQKPKEATFRVQFNDTLTSTFEYPSEASLVVDDSMSERYASEDFMNTYENLVLEPAITPTDSPKHHHHVAVDEIIPLPTHTTGSTNNSSPTSKMLGSLPLGSAPLGFYTPIKAPIDNLFQLGVTRAPNGHGLSHNTNTTTTTNGTTNGDSKTDSGVTSNVNDEPDSLQYLKPANDDLTIAYSEGAQKTDLLY